MQFDLEKVRQMFGGPNATFAEPPTVDELDNLKMVRAMRYAIESGQRFLFIGGQGIGKTSLMRALLSSAGIVDVFIPAAMMSPENLMVPFPVDDEELGHKVLEYLFYKKLDDDAPKAIIIDDLGREDPGMSNILMEPLQEGTLGGRKIKNLVTVIASANPQGMGYGRLASLDFAQADRFATVEVSANDTPWPRALAAHRFFAGTDLSKVFDLWFRLTPEIREVLSPRVLEHVLYALLRGFPGVCGLPIVAGDRVRLLDANGNDRTDKTLDEVAAALGVPNREQTPDIFERAIEALLADGVNVFLEGKPGIGKTSKAKAMLADKGIEAVYYSAPVLNPEDMAVPFPVGDHLEVVTFRKLMRPGRKALILDEAFRGTRRTSNMLMEPIQERSVGGEPIPDFVGTIALNNPKEMSGFKLDVGRADLAQAARFTLSIQLRASDTKFGDFLLKAYGPEMEVFLDWWKEDLDDLGRDLITPRSLERLYGLWKAGLPLEWGKAYVGGEYVPVPLVDLQTRLDNQPLARLRAVAAKVDEYEKLLAAGDEANPEAHLAVFAAFSKAELTQLEEHFSAVVRLVRVLAQQHKINLIKPGGERQKFWHRVLMAAFPEVAASK